MTVCCGMVSELQEDSSCYTNRACGVVTDVPKLCRAAITARSHRFEGWICITICFPHDKSTVFYR